MSALGKIAAILGVKPKKTPVGNDLPQDGGITGRMPIDRETYKTQITPPQDDAPPPMAVRPKQELPIQTVGGTTVEQPYDLSRYDLSGMKPVGTPEDYQAKPEPLQGRIEAPMAVRPSPVDEQISTIANKDYTLQKDANGNVIHRDKDRDAKWSLKDKIGSTLLGILQGAAGGPIGMLAGGLNAGMDRNYLEKRQDAKDLNRLAPMQKLQQQNQEFNTQQKTRELQNDYLAVKPQIEQNKIQSKFDLEAQRQMGRLEVLQQKEASEGKKWKLTSKNGKLFKQYNDRLEPLIDPQTGQQEVDLVDSPVEYTTENGQKVYMKGSQIANAEGMKAYRDAMVKLSGERNDIAKSRLALDQAKFEQAKGEFATVQSRLQDAQSKGDDKSAREYLRQLTQMMQTASIAHGKGELDDDQYGTLMQTYGSLTGLAK